MRRRAFFKSFLGEAVSMADEIRGKPQFRLNELGQVPDRIIRTMVPELTETGPFRLEDGRLLLRDLETGEDSEVRIFSPEEISILDKFDGENNIGEIAQYLSLKSERDGETAYLQVKSLYLALAKRMVCVPRKGHDR